MRMFYMEGKGWGCSTWRGRDGDILHGAEGDGDVLHEEKDVLPGAEGMRMFCMEERMFYMKQKGWGCST